MWIFTGRPEVTHVLQTPCTYVVHVRVNLINVLIENRVFFKCLIIEKEKIDFFSKANKFICGTFIFTDKDPTWNCRPLPEYAWFFRFVFSTKIKIENRCIGAKSKIYFFSFFWSYCLSFYDSILIFLCWWKTFNFFL